MTTLGIDFGTCNSSAAFLVGPTVIYVKDPLSHMCTFPSSVCALPSGELLMGRLADHQRVTAPECYRQRVKHELQLGEAKIPLGQHIYHASEMVAVILARLKDLAERYLADGNLPAIKNVVLTIPVHYADFKRHLMQQAAQQAGFRPEQIHFLVEPVAAALGYPYFDATRSGQKVLIYDLGGGTFDVALLEYRKPEPRLLGIPAGLPWGGLEFDHLLYCDLLAQQQEKTALQRVLSDDDSSGSLLGRMDLLSQCAELKHILSEMAAYTFHFALANCTSGLDYHLTRQQFEAIILPKVNETIECSQGVLDSAQLTWQEIDLILLVGGSCRIPLIPRLLRKQGAEHVILAEDPELAVSRGAAFALVGKPEVYYTVNKNPWEAFPGQKNRRD